MKLPMIKVNGLLSIGGLLAAAVVSAQASTVTFATFSELGSANLFEFVNGPTANNAPTQGALRTLHNLPQSVQFAYLGIGNLISDLQGAQAAHVSLSATTTQWIATAGSLLVQPLNTLSISFTRDEAYHGLTNLLTVNVTPSSASLYGTRGGRTTTLTADNSPAVGDVITYSSDFIAFSSNYEADLALEFTSGTPCVTNYSSPGINCTAGGSIMHFLHTLTMAGSGSFASAPLPSPLFGTPEPGTLISIGAGFVIVFAGLRRRSAVR